MSVVRWCGVIVYLTAMLPILSAHIIHVPQDMATIQSALDSLASNDTVLVSAGTYEEFLVAPPLSFALIGALDPDSGETSLPLVNASGILADDTTAVLLLPIGSSAVIENLRLKNVSQMGIKSWADRVAIRNCIIDSVYQGFKVMRDSLGATILMYSTRFRANVLGCVLVLPGNFLRASQCSFEGRLGGFSPLVSASHSDIDSCVFSGNPGRYALTAVRGPHRIVNCVFSPIRTPSLDQAILLGDGVITFSDNIIMECVYGSHVIELTSNRADSVEICNNTFIGCRSIPDEFTPQGVLHVYTTGEAQRGALICGNSFIECSSTVFADDLSLGPYAPALISGNRFVRDSLNGLPSIAMSPNPGQPTPAMIDSNVFSGCGYALSGLGSADARNNYWGNSSGPFHATANPLGQGDTITGDVPFIPWLEDTTTGISELPNEVPGIVNIESYPNPFNSTVSIEFALTREQDITLEIFDVLGRQVATLLDERRTLGVHRVLWNADSHASGLYFARLTSGRNFSTSHSAKLLLMK